jgi:hypothetical protein
MDFLDTPVPNWLIWVATFVPIPASLWSLLSVSRKHVFPWWVALSKSRRQRRACNLIDASFLEQPPRFSVIEIVSHDIKETSTNCTKLLLIFLFHCAASILIAMLWHYQELVLIIPLFWVTVIYIILDFFLKWLKKLGKPYWHSAYEAVAQAERLLQGQIPPLETHNKIESLKRYIDTLQP